MEWIRQIADVARREDLDPDKLIDTVLHRTFCLGRGKFEEVLRESVENVKWHEAHAEAVARQQFTGANYDPELDILEIKKRVAEKIKALGVKASLRTRRHPNYLSIDIKEAPCGNLFDGEDNLTEEAVRLGHQVEDIAESYNFDHGDAWTDYCHENFSLHVEVRGRKSKIRLKESNVTLNAGSTGRLTDRVVGGTGGGSVNDHSQTGLKQ